MTWLVVFAVLVVLLALVTGSKRAGSPSMPWPLHKRRPLSEIEQSMYWRLRDVLPDHVVLAQVQLSRFIGINKGQRRAQWLPRINQKSIDFLICDRSFSIVAAIELDDSTHDREHAKKRDQQKNDALKSAGVPLIRYRASNLPDAVQLAVDILRPGTIKADAPTQRMEPTL